MEMSAFGDFLLFSGLFGFSSLVPTTLALWFLRQFVRFWNGLSTVSLCFATTGPVAAIMVPGGGGELVLGRWFI